MPKAKVKAESEMARAWARTKGGMTKALFTITPEQEAELRAEAFKRATARGSGRPDASEVVREILAAWMKKRGR